MRRAHVATANRVAGRLAAGECGTVGERRHSLESGGEGSFEPELPAQFDVKLAERVREWTEKRAEVDRREPTCQSGYRSRMT